MTNASQNKYPHLDKITESLVEDVVRKSRRNGKQASISTDTAYRRVMKKIGLGGSINRSSTGHEHGFRKYRDQVENCLRGAPSVKRVREWWKRGEYHTRTNSRHWIFVTPEMEDEKRARDAKQALYEAKVKADREEVLNAVLCGGVQLQPGRYVDFGCYEIRRDDLLRLCNTAINPTNEAFKRAHDAACAVEAFFKAVVGLSDSKPDAMRLWTDGELEAIPTGEGVQGENGNVYIKTAGGGWAGGNATSPVASWSGNSPVSMFGKFARLKTEDIVPALVQTCDVAPSGAFIAVPWHDEAKAQEVVDFLGTEEGAAVLLARAERSGVKLRMDPCIEMRGSRVFVPAVRKKGTNPFAGWNA
mgnify:CR=1 FL=1